MYFFISTYVFFLPYSSFFCIDFLFIVIQVVEIIDRYDYECIPEDMRNDKVGYIQNGNSEKSCTRTLKVSSFSFFLFFIVIVIAFFFNSLKRWMVILLQVPKDMKQPIYIYYELSNFYQNHRRYACAFF